MLSINPHASALVYMKKFNGFGGDFPISSGNLSQDRSVRAADGLNTFDHADSPAVMDVAFGLLDRVAFRSHRDTFTQWRVVFDIRCDRVYYQTRDNPIRREIDMQELDFSCTDPIKIGSINANHAGNADGFVDYSHDRNHVWVETFFDPHPLKPKETEARVDRISRYPDSFLGR